MNKNEELLPYYEKAKERLNYDPKTGVFSRYLKLFNKHKEVGNIANHGYMRVGINLNGIQRSILLHRLAWYIHYGSLPNIIDHIDGDVLNNSIKNLRSCTQQQNTYNRKIRKDNKTGYKGVSWSPRLNKWYSQIQIKGEKMHLGCYDSMSDAIKAYEYKAEELFGEFKRNKGEEL